MLSCRRANPVTIYRYDCEAVLVHFEEGAGVDGAAFVVAADGKRVGNHGFQLILPNFQGSFGTSTVGSSEIPLGRCPEC